jgi:hypothetical protein
MSLRDAMPSTAICSIPPPTALMIGTLWLSSRAMVGSDIGPPCPPVVEYSAADEVES